MNFDSVVKEIKKTTFKVWSLPEFSDSKKEIDIMGEMPNYNEYLKKKNLIQKDLHKVTPELRQFYCEPLLDTDQEYHLFRKMNFIKYKAKIYLNWHNVSPTKKLKNIIVNLMIEANRIRNLITCCNTRLASLVIKKRKDYYNNNIDDLLSDCFFNIMKAVDGFDFNRKNDQNRRNKFSTYCTWVLMNNSLRDHSSDRKFHDKCASNLEDTSFSEKIDEKESNIHYEYEEKESRKSDVSKILKNLRAELPRELFVLKNYYGIDQEDRKTLKEISEDMDLTKERVRQLRENAIAYIRKQIEKGYLELSAFSFF